MTGTGSNRAGAMLDIPDRGRGSTRTPPDGIAGTSLAKTVRDRLVGLEIGQTSEPLEQRPYTSWFTILEKKRPPGRSIYDPEVQLSPNPNSPRSASPGSRIGTWRPSEIAGSPRRSRGCGSG